MRIAGVIAVGLLLFYGEVSTVFCSLLILAFGGLVEAHRANRGLDAMIQLAQITSDTSNKPS